MLVFKKKKRKKRTDTQDVITSTIITQVIVETHKAFVTVLNYLLQQDKLPEVLSRTAAPVVVYLMTQLIDQS